MDSSGSGLVSLLGSYEHGNEPSLSTEDDKFLG